MLSFVVYKATLWFATPKDYYLKGRRVMKTVFAFYRGKTSEEMREQKKYCDMYASIQGWEIEEEFYSSGNMIGLPDKLFVIREAALNHEFDILLVYEYKNVGRYPEETSQAINWFKENSIDVVSVKYEKRDFRKEALKIIKDINLSKI